MDTSEFTDEQIDALQALADGYNDQSVSRRDVMKLVGAGGVGALLGGGGAASAVGQANAGTAQSGQLGAIGDPLDLVVEDLKDGQGNTVASANAGALEGAELQYDSVNADDIATKSLPRVDATHPDYGADPTGATDTKPVLDAIFADLPDDKPHVIHFPRGEYLISNTFVWDQHHVLMGDPGAAARWVNSSDDSIVNTRFVVDDSLADPAIVVGGTADTNQVQGGNNYGPSPQFHHVNFMPQNEDNADEAILLDGSNTRDANRYPLSNVYLNDVIVQGFANQGIRTLGNVFDVRLDMCAFRAPSASAWGYKNEKATSNAGINRPGQQVIYDTHFRGPGSAADLQYARVLGGTVATGENGLKGTDRLHIFGTHIEGTDDTTGYGIQISQNEGHHIKPETVGGYDEGIRLGTTGGVGANGEVWGRRITGRTHDVLVPNGSGGFSNLIFITEPPSFTDNNGLLSSQTPQFGPPRYNPGESQWNLEDIGLYWYISNAAYPSHRIVPDAQGDASTGSTNRMVFKSGGSDRVYWDMETGAFRTAGNNGSFQYDTRSSDPGTTELPGGHAMVYTSDGSAGVSGANGDVILAVNSGGTIKTTTLADFSAL